MTRLGVAVLALIFVGGSSRPVGAEPPTTAEVARPTDPAETVGYQIPFDYAPPMHPLLVVRVRINGSDPLPFVINTSASAGLFVFPWAVKQAKMNLTEKTIVADDNKTKLGIIEGGTLEFQGRTKTDNVPANIATAYQIEMPDILEGYDKQPLAGMIGGETLLLLSSRFDFDTKNWTIYGTGPAPRPQNSRKLWEIDLNKDGNVPVVQARLTPVAGAAPLPVSLVLNTASM